MVILDGLTYSQVVRARQGICRRHNCRYDSSYLSFLALRTAGVASAARALQVVTATSAKLVVVGPHGSTTPGAALKKLDADIVVLGECEEILPQLAGDLSEVLRSHFGKARRWLSVDQTARPT